MLLAVPKNCQVQEKFTKKIRHRVKNVQDYTKKKFLSFEIFIH